MQQVSISFWKIFRFTWSISLEGYDPNKRREKSAYEDICPKENRIDKDCYCFYRRTDVSDSPKTKAFHSTFAWEDLRVMLAHIVEMTRLYFETTVPPTIFLSKLRFENRGTLFRRGENRCIVRPWYDNAYILLGLVLICFPLWNIFLSKCQQLPHLWLALVELAANVHCHYEVFCHTFWQEWFVFMVA